MLLAEACKLTSVASCNSGLGFNTSLRSLPEHSHACQWSYSNTSRLAGDWRGIDPPTHLGDMVTM
jgi:hypothetical protein